MQVSVCVQQLWYTRDTSGRLYIPTREFPPNIVKISTFTSRSLTFSQHAVMISSGALLSLLTKIF